MRTFFIFLSCLVTFSLQLECFFPSDTTYGDYTEAFSTDTYCGEYVTYRISINTALTAADRHANALKLYKTVSVKWYLREDDEDNPTNDCLGAGRQFFCATQFPACDANAGDNLPVCDFLCLVFKRRCYGEPEYYNKFCSVYDLDDKGLCSFSNKLSINIILIMISSALTLLFS